MGPTAVGKTSLAIEIALNQNAEILSCDSRQFYKEMKIGTAPPTSHQLSKVPHHFVQQHSIFKPISAADFEKSALEVIRNYDKQYIVMVGGSGLYAQALLYGLDNIPKIPEELRNSLERQLAEQGLESLQMQLKSLDRETYAKIDIKNSRRVIRALEIRMHTGKSPSHFYTPKKMRFARQVFVLTETIENLRKSISTRVDDMIKKGLIEEVSTLLNDPKTSPLITSTVGYQELIPYVKGRASRIDCIEKIKSNTLKYAKRQLTWFKKMTNTVYISPPNQSKKILSYYQKTSF